MRRRPEDMGLRPDGRAGTAAETGGAAKKPAFATTRASAVADIAWSRREALGTSAFWLIVITFGVSHVGVTGLNLHVFSFVSDQGHSAMVAAFVMSIIAVMQFSTPMVWGVLAERVNVPRLIMAKFLVQAVGILLALSEPGLPSLYAGFFLYGIGMGGTAILAELIWANYFGRITLGKIRGMGSLMTSVFSAGGPPFFGLLFDATQSYQLSFSIFIGMLFASAGLSLLLRPPTK
jgi:cyanate permease